MGNGLDSAEELYTDNSYDYYNTQGVGQWAAPSQRENDRSCLHIIPMLMNSNWCVWCRELPLGGLCTFCKYLFFCVFVVFGEVFLADCFFFIVCFTEFLEEVYLKMWLTFNYYLTSTPAVCQHSAAVDQFFKRGGNKMSGLQKSCRFSAWCVRLPQSHELWEQRQIFPKTFQKMWNSVNRLLTHTQCQ